MRIRYRQLVGKPAIAADGRNAGRIADLVAERHGDALGVTALLAGLSALIRRITFKSTTLCRVAPPHKVPWEAVERIEKQVRLRINHDDWATVDECEAGRNARASVAAAERRP